MDEAVLDEIKKKIMGDIADDDQTLIHYSHDASLFEVRPELVVFPKSTADVKNLVKIVAKNKAAHPDLSLTARSAGTDMSGGSINDSIIIVFTKYLNRFIGLDDNIATCQPGIYYRDFEDATLKHGLIFPAYPASREICALGGIINNNSAGEKSLEYGTTQNYVQKLKVVLSDGNEYVLKSLDEKQLDEKLKSRNFEGEIYTKIFKLIDKNYDLLQKAKPTVSKNAAGYFLWNVYDKKKKIFDLTKLLVGAQGTLGIVTEASIKLVPIRKHSEMVIVFVNDLENLGQIINTVLPLKPESFETYDDNTLKLAVKFFYEFAKMLGARNVIETAWHFLPEFWMMATGGVPKLILQVEFTGDDRRLLTEKTIRLKDALKPFNLKIRIAPTKKAEKKYWLIRRESFNLLRHKIKDKHTAPFIDDFALQPQVLTEFLPKLYKIFAKYPSLIYTIAGHLGNGNFHIIPLMNLADENQRAIIPKLGREVYDLVLKYKGTLTAEHNDGLIRTPYLKHMYGTKITNLFKQTKEIFDPQNIFNPRKKVNPDLDFAMNHIRTSW